jgi:hypothetical protein
VKSLDEKLAKIRSGGYTPKDFIIADAKDADMALGQMAPGPEKGQGDGHARGFASRKVYLEAIRKIVHSGQIDILLASASTVEILAGEDLFAGSYVTPAVRCNDTTDIWFPRGGRYAKAHSRPFRTANLEAAKKYVDLGLYSLTFSNDPDRDATMLEAYSQFRRDASAAGMRHFLEVFNPPDDADLPPETVGTFVGDSITRCLAGVVSAEQPIFLKIAFNGRRAMEELAAYDPERLVVGILGGAKGTMRDTFELLSQSVNAGARVALFGRKINYAEEPLTLLGLMRRVIEGDAKPQDAVRLYHDALQRLGIHPNLSLEEDCSISDPVLKLDA